MYSDKSTDTKTYHTKRAIMYVKQTQIVISQIKCLLYFLKGNNSRTVKDISQ